MAASSGVAAAGLGLTAIVGWEDPRQALASYLVAWLYWLGVALGSLVLLGAFHAARARWPVVFRRFLETIPQVIPLFAVLFLPVIVGMKHVLVWVDREALTGALARAVEHKSPYLNSPFFVARVAVYFLVWTLIARQLHAWSVQQDTVGGHDLTVKQRRLGTGALPVLAITLTFASIDWMMSLDPSFSSTVFGVYWFAGNFTSSFAVIVVAAAVTRNRAGQFGRYLNDDHTHALGKFLLAFTVFWAYIAFSQFMLVWIANIPEETPWYSVRTRTAWGAVWLTMALGHFLIPFFLLLSRDLKRSPRALALVAGLLLLAHWLDVYWIVMPSVHASGPRPSWLDLTAFVGVGAAALAFLVLRMRGAATLPIHDPYLEESVRYGPR